MEKIRHKVWQKMKTNPEGINEKVQDDNEWKVAAFLLAGENGPYYLDKK